MAKKTTLVPVEKISQVQQSPILPDELLKVEEVMKILDVSRTEIYYLMKGGMPHYKLGKKQRNLRFDRQKLAVWLQEQQIGISVP